MTDTATAPTRKVGLLLGIGIFLLPYVFAWFTLRKGHSTLSRVLSLGWLAFCLLAWVLPHQPATSPTTAVTASPGVSSEEAPATKETAPAKVAEPQAPTEPASKWRYSEDVDAMRNEKTSFAQLKSENEAEFDFPYNGGSSAYIEVRRRPEDGLQVLVSVDKGQFMCNSFSGTTVNIKYDNGPVQKVGCTDTSSGNSDTIFLRTPARVLANLKAAKTVIIEPEFYQSGRFQFTFDARGLEFK